MRTSLTLKFRPSRSVGRTGSLYFQFIKGRRSACVTTPYRIYPSEWDVGQGCVVIPTADLSRAVRLGKIVQQLNAERGQVRKALTELENGGDYTLEDAVVAYRDRDSTGKLRPFVERLKAKLLRDGQERTARSYTSVANKLLQYRDGMDVLLSQIDEAMVTDFDRWMKRCGNSGNTRSFYLRGLRTILNKAVRCGALDLLPDNLFENVKTGICKTRKRALKPDVLRAVAGFDFSRTEEPEISKAASEARPEHPLTLSDLCRDRRAGLAFSRDLFMLSFYMMGISFVDLAFLKKSDLSNGIVCYRRSKTDQTIFVAVTPEIQAILDRYAHLMAGSDYLLPIITRTDKPARLQYESALRTHNNRLRRLSLMIGGGRKRMSVITSYVARHSWANIARLTGAKVCMISQGLGHESERTTAIYLDSVDFSAIRALNQKVIRSVLAA